MSSLLCKMVIVILRVCVLSCISFFVIPWTVVCQASVSMGFSRQVYCSEFPFPSQGYLPIPGIKPTTLEFLNWQADSLLLGPPGNIITTIIIMFKASHCS